MRALLTTVRGAWQLLTGVDMYDMNYMYASDRFNVSVYPPSFYCGRQGIPLRLMAFSLHLAQSILGSLRRPRVRIEPDAIVFYAASLNQSKSVLPLIRKMHRGYGVGEYVKDTENFPLGLAYLLGLLFMPWSLAKFVTSSGFRRESYAYIADLYLLFPGYLLVASWWLHRKRPRLLVLANDHSMQPRTLRHAAARCGIPTVYLQHASVMERFPALSFDYALLDGRAALEAYDHAGPSMTKVFLTGMAMADSFVHRANPGGPMRTIGLCVGSLEPIERVDELVRHLRERHPQVQILLRPHPAEARGRLRAWHQIRSRYGLGFSRAQTEMSFAYLARCDVIIAGDSGILLEAALMNVTPLYYDFPQLQLDFYGFQKQGLVRYRSAAQQIGDAVADLLHRRPDSRPSTKPFCATVGTRYFGLSSQLAATLLYGISEQGSVPDLGWKRVEGLRHLEAYELDPNAAVVETSSSLGWASCAA